MPHPIIGRLDLPASARGACPVHCIDPLDKNLNVVQDHQSQDGCHHSNKDAEKSDGRATTSESVGAQLESLARQGTDASVGEGIQ